VSPHDSVRVVLVAPRNPLNIGAAARAMSNFGFQHLRVVNPYEVAFREARSGVGAGPVMQAAKVFSSVAEAVADAILVVGTTSVGHRELQHPLRRLDQAARFIRRKATSGVVALLFGSEKFGLSNDDLSHCHWLLRIPMADPHQSMNLGQAVAVCLYELGRTLQGRAAPPKRRKAATAGEVEQITRLLIEVARTSGYVKPKIEQSTEQKLRRMVRRLELSASDAPLWLGVLRQALWALGRSAE